MTVALSKLEDTLGQILEPERFQDYAPNGLQVEGREQVSLLVTGVTASQALIDAAVDAGADAILVHHGFFWKGESPVLRGMKRRRLATLLANDLNLFAYHLPLDAHPEHGNNAALARLLAIRSEGPLRDGDPVGNVGSLLTPQPVSVLLERICERLGRPPLHIGDATREVQRIAWCTGAAQSYIDAAVSAGVDLYLTGEVSEQTVHVAREEGIEFVAAGHHATERYGVQAVGEALAEVLEIEHRFIDIDNPV
ncbi:MAG: Nif3-like dinuclear metal center hexameric protein [Pseudomonadota bacterium]